MWRWSTYLYALTCVDWVQSSNRIAYHTGCKRTHAVFDEPISGAFAMSTCRKMFYHINCNGAFRCDLMMWFLRSSAKANRRSQRWHAWENIARWTFFRCFDKLEAKLNVLSQRSHANCSGTLVCVTVSVEWSISSAAADVVASYSSYGNLNDTNRQQRLNTFPCPL